MFKYLLHLAKQSGRIGVSFPIPCAYYNAIALLTKETGVI